MPREGRADTQCYLDEALSETEPQRLSHSAPIEIEPTETVPLPITCLPFIVEGLNRHCFTANSADPRSTGWAVNGFG